VAGLIFTIGATQPQFFFLPENPPPLKQDESGS